MITLGLAFPVLREFLPTATLGPALCLLVAIAVIDWRTRMIPDYVNLPFLGLSLLYAYVSGTAAILGPLLLGIFFATQWAVSRGRWMGSGDVLLGISIGFLLGDWQKAILCLVLTYVLGGGWGLALFIRKSGARHRQIAFAPFLAAACMITLLFGDSLLCLGRLAQCLP